MRIRCISDIITVLALLQRGRHDIEINALLEPLIGSIARLLCSASCRLIFERVTTEHPNQLSVEQAAFLSSCLNYADGYKASLRVQIQRDIRSSLLPMFASWMTTPTLFFQQWHNSIRTLVRSCSWTMIERISLTEDESNLNQFETDDCRLLDAYVTMLTCLLEMPSSSYDDITLTLVHSLYLFTLMPAWIPFIKSHQLRNLLLQYAQSSDENIVLDAYRCRASTMTEEDIKVLQNAYTIANVFLKYFRHFG